MSEQPGIVITGASGRMGRMLIATVADNAPKEQYGSAYGLFNFVGMSSSILAPTIARLRALRSSIW